MPTNFGTTPLSTTTLGANQFPGTAVFVPGSGAAGNLTMVEGIAINTDANSFQTSAVRMGQLDGDNVTQGLKADAAVTGDTAGTLSAKLRGLNKVLASLNAAGQNAASPANELLIAGQFNTTPTTITSGNISPLQLDSSGNLLVNIKTPSTLPVSQSGTWNVGSSTATGSAVPANAFYLGGDAATSLPTAATAGNLTGLMMDKFGREVVLPGTIRDLRAEQTTTISNSTSETTIFTAVASVFLDPVVFLFSNTSGTATRIDIRDTTGGSIIFSIYVPAGDTRGFSVPGETVPQTTVNTNWTAQCATAVTDIRVYVLVDKNK